MLKIGLLGYGKMGRAIEKIALQQGMEIVWRIHRENAGERTTALLRTADVVIEFSRPEAAFDNVMACLEAGVPVVSGTTGWADELSKAQDFCQKNGGAFLWASNFSIGVNLFFALNRFLSQHMSHRGEYQPMITETHHIHKLDAPSGTALTLVNELIAAVPRLKSFALQDQNTIAIPPPETVPITAIREERCLVHTSSAGKVMWTKSPLNTVPFPGPDLLRAPWWPPNGSLENEVFSL